MSKPTEAVAAARRALVDHLKAEGFQRRSDRPARWQKRLELPEPERATITVKTDERDIAIYGTSAGYSAACQECKAIRALLLAIDRAERNTNPQPNGVF